jgi:hypothetical protein
MSGLFRVQRQYRCRRLKRMGNRTLSNGITQTEREDEQEEHKGAPSAVQESPLRTEAAVRVRRIIKIRADLFNHFDFPLQSRPVSYRSLAGDTTQARLDLVLGQTNTARSPICTICF